MQYRDENGKIKEKQSIAKTLTKLGAYGLLNELYGGEIPKQRVERLVREGKMPREAVIKAEAFWETDLRKPLLDPRGVNVTVTLNDVYHVIVDPRIWRHPERIKKILNFVVEIVESKTPGFEVLISEWGENGKTIYAYAVIALNKTLKVAHVVDKKKIRQLKKGAKVLWVK